MFGLDIDIDLFLEQVQMELKLAFPRQPGLGLSRYTKNETIEQESV